MMDSIGWVLGLVVAASVVAGLVVAVVRRRRDESAALPAGAKAVHPGVRGAATAAPSGTAVGFAAPDRAARTAPATTTRPEPPPVHPALAALKLRRADDLTPEERQTMAATFRDVPRPPRLLTQLISMDVMHEASSAELVGMISREPLIASKILAAVNSPLHGLTRTVGNLGQAVAFLGVNRVRAICLQYALMEAFKTASPERARRLESIWNAGALAGELCQHPMQAAGAGDSGGLTSGVVLSFLGSVAVAVAAPRALLVRLPARDFLRRTTAEQEGFGLCATEIGRVLMTQWDLPAPIVDGVAAIDRVLVTPWRPGSGATASRAAFGYLCARLGERLAWGELDRLPQFDLAAEPADGELACAATYLGDPTFRALVDQLRSPRLGERIAAVVGPLRGPVSASPAVLQPQT